MGPLLLCTARPIPLGMHRRGDRIGRSCTARGRNWGAKTDPDCGESVRKARAALARFRERVFAVVRLMINPNSVDCITGNQQLLRDTGWGGFTTVGEPFNSIATLKMPGTWQEPRRSGSPRLCARRFVRIQVFECDCTRSSPLGNTFGSSTPLPSAT
jgi:hypothetical protein